MAAFREQVNQKLSDNEDCCIACFSATKYSRITFYQQICNICSKYELNEEKCGWEAENMLLIANHVTTHYQNQPVFRGKRRQEWVKERSAVALCREKTSRARTKVKRINCFRLFWRYRIKTCTADRLLCEFDHLNHFVDKELSICNSRHFDFVFLFW